MIRQLLLLLAVCSTASAASPASTAAAKFDQKKVDKSLLQNDRLWPEGFLRTEFLFPPVRDEQDSEDGIAIDTVKLAPPRPATVKFPSARPTRARRAAPVKRRIDDSEIDSFLRSSTKSKPQNSDDFSDDAFWRDIEKKAMEDIAMSKKGKSLPNDAFNDDAAAGKELAALSESIDGPPLRGEKVRLPSSSLDDSHFVGTTARPMFSQESLTATAAAGMVGTKFTDWNTDTKDDFEAWLRSKGEAIPSDLFETTTVRTPAPPRPVLPEPTVRRPAPPPPELPEPTATISAPVQTTPSIAPIQLEPWNQIAVPDSFTAIPSIQEEPSTQAPTTTAEPWTPEPTTTEPWTPPPPPPQNTPQPWIQQAEDTTQYPPSTPPDILGSTVPLAPTVAKPATVVHFDAGVDPDFPLAPPKARGLHNVPAGHNLDRQIDWDFARGFRDAPYYPDPAASSPAIFVQPVPDQPAGTSFAEMPQQPYTASYGRKDAEVVAALIEGLLPQAMRPSYAETTQATAAPAAPLQYPSAQPEYSVPPGYVAVPASWLNQQTTTPPAPPQYPSAPQYSVPPGYVAVPDSWLNRPTEVVGRSQYESAPPEVLQQSQRAAWQRAQQLQQGPIWSQQQQSDVQQQLQQGGWRAPYGPADNSGFTGRTSIGTTIVDPNYYFPEANGALYLGPPQTVFYARPRLLPREPLIVGNTPQWALGPQRLFKLDPRTPAAEWRGQSLAPFVAGALPAQYRPQPQYHYSGTVPRGYGSPPQQQFVQSALSIEEAARFYRGRR